MKPLLRILSFMILIATIQGCAYYPQPYVYAPPVSIGITYPNRGFYYTPRYYPRYYSPMPFRGGHGGWGGHHGWGGHRFH